MPDGLASSATAMRIWRGIIVAIVLFAGLMTVASHVRAEEGLASWYGNESGSRTASGERFDPSALTCAMPSYRAGRPTYSVRVTDLRSGRSIVCRVNDRGPARWTHRIVDLSRGAAVALFGKNRHGRPAKGLARVRVDRIH